MAFLWQVYAFRPTVPVLLLCLVYKYLFTSFWGFLLLVPPILYLMGLIQIPHIARTIFFATLYGKDTESALPLLNLLDILTIENTFKFQALKFIHNWHIKKLPSIFTNSFTYAKDIHSYNTRYASKDNIHKVRTRTNIGKQTIASLASELWQELPTDLKNLSSNCFSKQVKQHLLRKQSYL